MAQTGYTPIQLYFSSTTTNAPLAANLASGELAINITDGKLFYKDNANAVQVIGWKVVPATAGGTGQTSYAVGDLIYANTTTTLAKLPDVATGNALISGGIGVAPSWGKIGLTTHVSGTLPTANGGTNLTSFTANGVVYASSTSVLATGSALLFDGSNLGVGSSSADPAGSNVVGSCIAGAGYISISRNGTTGYFNRISTDGSIIDIKKNGATVGSISVSGSTTAYNTSSDYRLKHDISPITDALKKVALLKPCTYKWNLDGSEGEGFIAHELAEICPQAVTGNKDATETYIDKDGNEQTRSVYQGIDVSFLVATLTAAIQEQQVLITQLTERISALEGK